MEYQVEEIQATAAKDKTKIYEVVITALYCPARYANKKNQYLNFLKSPGYKFIIGDDFITKYTHWGSKLTTTKGKEVLSACYRLNCDIISTGKPTYYPTDYNKIPGLIDFFYYREYIL